MFRVLKGAVAGIAAFAAMGTAHAVEDFYKGNTITILIAQGPGGGYDHYSRLLANYMGAHIPGAPKIQIQYMPGAAGVKGTNYLYSVSPKDGTVFGMPPYALGHIQLLQGNVRYDTAKLNYLGRMAGLNGMLMVSDAAPAKTLEALKTTEVIIAAGGVGGQSYMNPTLMKNLLGLKLKVVTGYTTGAATMDMAIDRGEAHGRVGIWVDLLIGKKDQIDAGKIIPLIEVGLEKTDASPKGVPLVADLATDPDSKTILEFMASASSIGRVFALPPGVPADRLAALRKAFDTTMKDPQLLAEAKKRNFVIEPMSGEDLQKMIARTLAISPALIEKAKVALKRG